MQKKLYIVGFRVESKDECRVDGCTCKEWLETSVASGSFKAASDWAQAQTEIGGCKVLAVDKVMDSGEVEVI